LTQGNISHILPSIAKDHLSSEKRLGIYFDAYRIRLMEILKLDFPKTHTLMGDDAFDDAFFQYLAKYPSEHFSVRYFGERFPLFLKETKPYSEIGILTEMAHFEWCVAFTLDAKDDTVVSVQTLAAIPGEDWPDLQITFHPSVKSHQFAWDTPQLWQHIEKEEPPRGPVLQPSLVRWLFWRSGIRSLFQSCTPVESTMFELVNEQKYFAEICEILMETFEEEQIPVLAAQTLHKWVSSGMIARILHQES
jgi:hypothetical protein